jgi:hypothetical protein
VLTTPVRWSADWWARLPMLAVRFLLWITDMDDGSGSGDWERSSPSATKVLGAAAVLVGLWIMAVTRRADGAAVSLVALGITAVFGRSMWKLWLARNTWSSALQSNVSASYAKNEAVHHTIIEMRRHVDDGGFVVEESP